MASGTAAKTASKTKGEGIFAKIIKFIRESYNETRFKSAWPTWPELRQFTIVVLVALIIVTLWIGGLDYLIGRIVSRLPG